MRVAAGDQEDVAVDVVAGCRCHLATKAPNPAISTLLIYVTLGPCTKLDPLTGQTCRGVDRMTEILVGVAKW